MNMKTYLQSLGSDAERQKYADRANTNLNYLNNQLYYGYREPKKLQTIIDLIEGSGGKITLRELCPKMMAGQKGRKHERTLIKALAAPVVDKGKAA